MMNFDHPNLIKFFAAYKDSKRYYIITELCQGGPLLDKLTTGKNKFFSERDALKIMHQVFQAINYCHSQNIVHHEISPENILLVDDND